MDKPCRHSIRKQHDEALEALKDAATSEERAVAFVETVRWGDKPTCPRCGSENVYRMTDRATGQRNRDFRWRCRGCGKRHTVRTGTVMEETRLPIRYWVHAFWRACASKKGISALQLSRELDVTPKTAWFLLHCIRLAMSDWDETTLAKLGGEGKTIEADETYVGGKPRRKGESKRGRGTSKTPVFAVVERGGGVRMRVMERLTADDLCGMLTFHADGTSRLITDELSAYKVVGSRFASHEFVTHTKGEYTRKEDTEIHSNTVESAFSILKRSIYGTYHSVSKKHLPRYLAEHEFRWCRRCITDAERTRKAIFGAEGKRLVYRAESAAGTLGLTSFSEPGDGDGEEGRVPTP